MIRFETYRLNVIPHGLLCLHRYGAITLRTLSVPAIKRRQIDFAYMEHQTFVYTRLVRHVFTQYLCICVCTYMSRQCQMMVLKFNNTPSLVYEHHHGYDL